VWGQYSQFKTVFPSYFKAGGFILLRTLAKITTYTMTASAAARLGTIQTAAYAITFNLGDFTRCNN
jgi:Na+-driven multidrug efflux pump